MEKQQKTKRFFVGNVISNNMDKTVVVSVVQTLKHPVFQKVLRQEKIYKVHDPESKACVGDVVEFVFCRPISKTKHSLLTQIIKKQDSDDQVGVVEEVK